MAEGREWWSGGADNEKMINYTIFEFHRNIYPKVFPIKSQKNIQLPRPIWIWNSRCINKSFNLASNGQTKYQKYPEEEKIKIEGNNYNCIMCAHI